MRLRKTHEEFISQLININPNIEVIEKYTGVKNKLKCKCLIDKYEWYVTPSDLLSGKGCPSCGRRNSNNARRKSQDVYIHQLELVNPDIEPIGEYINAKTKILHKCKKHGMEFRMDPTHALRGQGCYLCKKEKCTTFQVKDHNTYEYEISNINSNISVVDNYINAATPILHKCKIHNYTWYAKPNHILHGHGCPMCASSIGEKSISQTLKRYGVTFEQQKVFNDCKDKRPLSFDFYLPLYNMCIEYQGEQHYKPIEYFGGEEQFKIQQLHDDIKRDYCKNHGIFLLEISYWEFDNIEQILNKQLLLHEDIV